MNFRPQRLSEIIDNETNNKLILAMSKHGGPSTLIFSGSYGCGKTTLARLVPKVFNCLNLTDDICGECESCKSDILNSPLYLELDASMIGRVEAIDDLYEDLTFVPKNKKRVIVFDEFHLTSRQAQSKMLKLFEDAPQNIYYILCTTDKNAILPTIISRSLTLNFNTKSKEEVINNINKLAKDQNINISQDVANLIAIRSKGHMRDAHKLFEKYLLIGENDFLKLEESGYIYLAKYFAQVLWLIKNNRSSVDEIKKHKTIMLEIVDRLMKIPIALLKDDYQNLFLDLAKKLFNPEYTVEPIIEALINTYDSRSILNLYKIALDDFMMSSFDSDIRFQTALLSIYQRLIMGI
jgi:DNA polymerase III subunit gamma/tau